MQEKKHLQLNDLEVYKVAFSLSNYVWFRVEQRELFAKRSVGIQFVMAVDSISANISEGFGRYSKKDEIKFYRYAQGSMYESFDWNEKASARQLLTVAQHQHILDELKRLPKAINSLIKYTNNNLTI